MKDVTLNKRVDGCVNDTIIASAVTTPGTVTAAGSAALEGVGVRSVMLAGGSMSMSW